MAARHEDTPVAFPTETLTVGLTSAAPTQIPKDNAHR